MKHFIPASTVQDLKREIEDLCAQADANSKYNFAPQSDTRQYLRQEARKNHGFHPNDTSANIRVITPTSPLARRLAKGDFETFQNNANIYYDQANCNSDLVLEIQKCKTGRHRTTDHASLESVGSYAIVRGQAMQEYDMSLSRSQCALDTPGHPPRLRTLYYLNTPKLLDPKSYDFKQYCIPGRFFTKGKLNPKRMGALKEKYKTILALAIKAAADNNEGFDMVTPNAFFYGLRHPEQAKAKKLFAKAVCELMCEINPESVKGFKGLFLHTDAKGSALFEKAHESGKLKLPVIINDKDASAPARIAQARYGWTVAESIMGEALGAVGNGGLGPRADQAKEENDFRQTPGVVPVFNPTYNTNLMKRAACQAVDVSKVLTSKHYQDPAAFKLLDLNMTEEDQAQALAALPESFQFINKKIGKLCPPLIRPNAQHAAIVNAANGTQIGSAGLAKGIQSGHNGDYRTSWTSPEIRTPLGDIRDATKQVYNGNKQFGYHQDMKLRAGQAILADAGDLIHAGIDLIINAVGPHQKSPDGKKWPSKAMRSAALQKTYLSIMKAASEAKVGDIILTDISGAIFNKGRHSLSPTERARATEAGISAGMKFFDAAGQTRPNIHFNTTGPFKKALTSALIIKAFRENRLMPTFTVKPPRLSIWQKIRSFILGLFRRSKHKNNNPIKNAKAVESIAALNEREKALSYQFHGKRSRPSIEKDNSDEPIVFSRKASRKKF